MIEKGIKPTIEIGQQGEVPSSPSFGEGKTGSEIPVDVTPVSEAKAITEEVTPIVEDSSQIPRISYGYQPSLEGDDKPAKIVSEKSLGYPPKY